MKKILQSFNLCLLPYHYLCALCLVPLVLCLYIVGCQGTRKSSSSTPKSNFPQIMVGVWEADINDNQESKWGIKFEKDGTINKIIHSVAGPIDLREGSVTGEGPDEGMYYYFIMGPCTSEYNPKTKKLAVKIIVDEYLMKLPTGELKGRIEDVLEGTIPAKKGLPWNVEWRAYGYLEGADRPDVNEINAHPEKLTFYKLDLKKLAEESKKPKEPNDANDPNAPVIPHRH
jgi:hypothetical protein